MNTFKPTHDVNPTGFLPRLVLSLLLGLSANISIAAIAQQPLFLTSSVPPIVMLTMGRDHKLYYEAYNDASDLNGDGLIDVGYKPGIDYYGYFDSHRCYDYNSAGYFEPKDATLNKTCSSVAGDWSGDFLNYITTARIDALRKVLYGGYRSEDTGTSTVLKRSFIPQDAHSWGKEYNPASNPGYLISDYTPLSQPALGTSHLFANVSLSYTGQPLLRVLNDSQYRIWEWVSIERPVAGTKCLNGGSGPNCVTAGGSTWSVVPSTVLTNLVRSTYDISGYGGGTSHPQDHNDFNTWVSAVPAIVPSLKLGSAPMTTIDATLSNKNNNPFGTDPDSNYLTIVKGNITVPTTGTYKFSVDGDDAVEVIINGSNVAGFYDGHGTCNCNSHTGSITLTAGTPYTIEFRHEERGGDDSFVLRWEKAFPASTMTDYSVNVKVCEAGKLEANCKAYKNGTVTTNKPTGLLHTYGENDSMAFGLLTGSYKKNISGGVLRKNIESFKNEVDPDTGIFTSANGIVNTINKLRINTFSYSSHEYASGWITTGPITEGQAAEWGNPIGEMMYEGLRYFAGKASPTSAFSIASTDAPDATLGLPLPNWLDPYADSPSGGGYLSCAKPMQLVISDINASYDTDQLPGSYFNTFSGDLSGLNVSTLADNIWAGESEASNVFIGQSGTLSDGAPTVKAASSFSNIRGLAPEEPTKLGGFYAGSVALHGARTDLNTAGDTATSTYKKDQKADTLAVALASPLPRIEIPVNGKTVTLVPFAKSVAGSSIDAASNKFQPTNQIVDFYVDKIVNTTSANIDSSVNNGKPYGKFRINYEDVEQAADHDMDAIVEYTFTVTGNSPNQVVVIDLNSTYAYGGITQHMGYVISGTTHDGVYLEVRDQLGGEVGADTDYFLDTPPGQLPGGTWNDQIALPFSTSRTFTAGTSTSASFIKHDPLWYAAKWGVNDKDNDGILDTNEWDDDSDGVPDGYFLVTNAGKLPEQLGKAFAKLLNNVSSASAVAANTTRLDTGTLLYQARFDPRDWSGQLLALTVNETTGVVNTTTPSWEAAELLPAAASRKIYTYDPSATAGSRGIEFKWNTPSTPIITTAQQAYLNQLGGIADAKGQDRLNWLRGDNANEKRLGGSFRNRIKLFDANGSFITDPTELSTASIKTNHLGDIVNSDPIYVGTTDLGYSDLPGVEGSGYTTFRASTTYKNRRPMLYVGANDGMLHGFDARENAGSVTTGGSEIFAYMPNALFPELSKLTSPTYSHQYFVDGAATAGDVYYSSEWHTLVAGVTGAGGKAVFALDVTNPDTFGTASALWEFTSTDTTYGADLGYTLSQPVIARMHNNKWAVIVANGYGSSNGSAVLFVLDAETGAVIQKIDTLATGGNGLSSPVAADLNGDNIVDTIYAGDLKGNLWEFDVSSATAGSWSVANSGSPLFVACTTTGTSCASGNLQPITAKPSIGKVGASQASGVMVYFGTGKYFESTDNIVGTNPQVQSFYGIWDDDTGTITDRAKLQEQTINFEGTPKNSAGTTKTGLIRVSSRKTVCYSLATVALSNDDTPLITCSSTNLKKGWAMNLEIPNTATPATPPTIAQGERVVSTPVMYRDLILFSTLIPSTDPCEGGGKSRVMILEALTGKRPAASTFDIFGTGSTTADGKVNTDDLVDVGGTMFVATGLDLGIDIHDSLSIISNFGFASGSSGGIAKLTLISGGTGKRASWRQLK